LLSRLAEQQVSVTASLNSAKKYGEDAANNLDQGNNNNNMATIIICESYVSTLLILVLNLLV
jgi:hypothetical protein